MNAFKRQMIHSQSATYDVLTYNEYLFSEAVTTLINLIDSTLQ